MPIRCNTSCWQRWSTNRRTPQVAFVLSTAFAVSQLIAAAVSHSLALLGDCILMLLDSTSYAINWAAERPGVGAARAATLQLRAAMSSAVVLIGTTIFIVIEAAGRLQEEAELPYTHVHASEDDVDMRIVLWFTLVNLFADILINAL